MWALAVLAAAAPAGAREPRSLGDPTRPALRAAPVTPRKDASSPLKLRSILLSSGPPLAVIDGRRVTLGDEIQGAVVTRIDLSGVRLRRGDRELELTLTGGATKKRSSLRSGSR